MVLSRTLSMGQAGWCRPLISAKAEGAQIPGQPVLRGETSSLPLPPKGFTQNLLDFKKPRHIRKLISVVSDEEILTKYILSIFVK